MTYIIVFRNGKIKKLWDIRDKKPRHVKKSLDIKEPNRAWYVIKVYGSDAPKNPENLDVMAVCERIGDGTFAGDIHSENSICLSSPFYFRPENTKDPEPLESAVKLTLIEPESNQRAKEATIDVLLYGKKIKKLNARDGRLSFRMPVNAMLKISAPGLPTIHRGLYLDYPPHRQLIETFANGRWLEHHSWKEKLGPGQVPWEAFQFEKTRAILSDVDWRIEMIPNERDSLWNDFEKIFK